MIPESCPKGRGRRAEGWKAGLSCLSQSELGVSGDLQSHINLFKVSIKCSTVKTDYAL